MNKTGFVDGKTGAQGRRRLKLIVQFITQEPLVGFI